MSASVAAGTRNRKEYRTRSDMKNAENIMDSLIRSSEEGGENFMPAAEPSGTHLKSVFYPGGKKNMRPVQLRRNIIVYDIAYAGTRWSRN